MPSPRSEDFAEDIEYYQKMQQQQLYEKEDRIVEVDEEHQLDTSMVQQNGGTTQITKLIAHIKPEE